MFETIGYGTYVFFTIFCAMAAVWAFFLVPEVSLSYPALMPTLKGRAYSVRYRPKVRLWNKLTKHSMTIRARKNSK